MLLVRRGQKSKRRQSGQASKVVYFSQHLRPEGRDLVLVSKVMLVLAGFPDKGTQVQTGRNDSPI